MLQDLWYHYLLRSDLIVLSQLLFLLFLTGAFLFESNRECCQIAPVGCLPPTWTSNLLWNKSTQAYGKKVDLYAGGTPVHDYYNDAMNNPVFLRVEDDDESWTFLSPLQVAPQDPAYFLIPSSCASSC